jgi:ubiquinone/menaquinone biosynthesis C-methylase UbiE
MRFIYAIFTAMFLLLVEESFFSWLNFRNITFAGTSLLKALWILEAASLFLLILTLFLSRRQELTKVRDILKTGQPQEKDTFIQYFNQVSELRDKWIKRHQSYHDELMRIFRFLVPNEVSVLEVGCGTGDTLGKLGRKKSAGIDISPGMINKAKKKYTGFQFKTMDIEDPDPSKLPEKFDYVIMSDLIGHLSDIQKGFEQSRRFMHENSRLIITYYSYFWEPVLRILEKLYLKIPQFQQNWLSQPDIINLLELAEFEVIKKSTAYILPVKIPLLSRIFNKFIVRLPLFRHFGLIQYAVARPSNTPAQDASLSVIIPARNEQGNIEQAVLRTPLLGKFTELIFVEGHSTDKTWDEIQRIQKKYRNTHMIKIMQQPGTGKGDAVRKGFQKATGDILTILDGDLTALPEKLSKFYRVFTSGQADFANGCRLVYPLEKKAMRFFNVLGNKFFSMAFTWLLDQPIKDTLCGTKMLRRSHYLQIAANRAYFGDFDPFGDFDLLFGASKLNLKIKDVPIRYQARTYGQTNIQRWRHGFLLLRMVLFASHKLKFF